MRQSEKDLLRSLKSDNLNNDEPLSNVKKGLGSVANVLGNPLNKAEITIDVAINFFNGLNQIAPAALPAPLQQSIPFYLFGLTDLYSGYPKAQNLLPVNNWESGINYSYREGPELIDQVAWLTAGYWSVASANYVFPGGFIQDVGNAAPFNFLERANFNWIPGHVYKISYTVRDFAGAGGSENALYDGVNNDRYGFHTRIPENRPFTIRNTVEYYYIPTTTELRLDSLTGVGDSLEIHQMSIKEVFGDVNFSSDNAIGIYGYNKSFVLTPNIRKGDLVLTYNYLDRLIDPIWGTPTINFYTCEIIIHCNNVAYGTFLNSFVSDLITINNIRYNVPIANINQFINPIHFAVQSLFGKLYTDTIDPRMYKTPADFQNQIADIPLNFPIDKNFIMGSYIDFDVEHLSFIFMVEKVEPLTHKQVKILKR